MEENNNIVKILENAPQGLKLYSLVHGEVTLNNVDTIQEYYPIDTINKQFTKDGKLYYGFEDAECILFPSKEHKSWDNWQEVLFQVGDVVTHPRKGIFIIIKKYDNTFTLHNLGLVESGVSINNYRYATPEEREQFFKVLNDNGYTWNTETKQLEKSLQYTPKYKVGDYMVNENEKWRGVFQITSIDGNTYYNFSDNKLSYLSVVDYADNYRLATEQELIDAGIIEKKHKFKAGDVIRNKETGTVRRINYLDTNWYILYQYNDEGMTGLNYKNEDKWELVTNQKPEDYYFTSNGEFFNWIYDRLVNVHREDPNVDYMQSLKSRIKKLFLLEKETTETTGTLTEEKPFTIDDFKPFDKVLVRNYDVNPWSIELYETYRYNNYYCMNDHYKKCIPYNAETAHLLNTTDDCPEKYKTWEE